MTSKDILVDMIRSINQDVLDEYKVTLRTDDLTFTDPVAGSFEDNVNTQITATSHHPLIKGSHTYFYDRIDMQQAFDDIGVPQPSVYIDGRVDIATVFNALKTKYNFYVQLEDFEEFTLTETTAYLKVKPNHLLWLGELTVLLTDTVVQLAQQFPDNVLNGMTVNEEAPLTDGGNYDELTAGNAQQMSAAMQIKQFDGFEPA